MLISNQELSARIVDHFQVVFTSLEGEKLVDYLKEFQENSLYQKTGFILENLQLNVPEKVIKTIQKRVSNKTYYLDKDRQSSYLARWNLMVPANFEELV